MKVYKCGTPEAQDTTKEQLYSADDLRSTAPEGVYGHVQFNKYDESKWIVLANKKHSGNTVLYYSTTAIAVSSNMGDKKSYKLLPNARVTLTITDNQ